MTEIDALRQMVDTLRATTRAADEQLAASQRAQTEDRGHRAAAVLRTQQLAEELQRSQAQIEGLHQSWSWRITAPLRAMWSVVCGWRR